jgi:hypothetical protein
MTSVAVQLSILFLLAVAAYVAGERRGIRWCHGRCPLCNGQLREATTKLWLQK